MVSWWSLGGLDKVSEFRAEGLARASGQLVFDRLAQEGRDGGLATLGGELNLVHEIVQEFGRNCWHQLNRRLVKTNQSSLAYQVPVQEADPLKRNRRGRTPNELKSVVEK